MLPLFKRKDKEMPVFFKISKTFSALIASEISTPLTQIISSPSLILPFLSAGLPLSMREMCLPLMPHPNVPLYPLDRFTEYAVVVRDAKRKRIHKNNILTVLLIWIFYNVVNTVKL